MASRPAPPRRRSVFDPRRWLILLGGSAVLLLAPLLARAQGSAADSVQFHWTAPGDDNQLGTATIYHMKYSTAPISTANWDAASSVPGMPAPQVAGSSQWVVVRGLSRDTTYYFAIRAEDDAGNLADISNVVRWEWVFDTAPPAAPSGLSATRAGASVQVNWNANSEADLQGYSVYRATSSGGTYTKLTSALLTNPSYLDSSIPSGTTDVWYQVSASDVSANEGARSAPFHLTLVTSTPAPVAGELSPGYPNPSHAGQPVCMPISLASSAAGVALDIVNAGGLRIRRLDVASAPRCPDGSLRWDGLNESGAEVAPGVYRAWLIDGDRRTSIKLVRQP